MSNQNAYEIRWSILQEAKGMLYEKWYKECEVAERNATKNSGQEVLKPSPSVEEIKELAESLYAFVQKKQ